MARRKAPVIADELLDQLLAGRDPQAALAKDGLIDELKRALTERALNAEMDHHLDGEAAEGRANSRNGYGRKTLLTDDGKLPISIPRDRLATFDPQLIAKYRRRLPGFDDKIVSMYARGMTVREIRGHLADLYGVDVSPDLVSAVTDAVLDEIAEWQERPLEALYPLVFFDALRVKIRDEGTVRNKAVYLALGVRADGRKEILGLWIEQTEGAKFWLRVMAELKNRGVEDVLIAVVDGLKGFPEAITAVFPDATVQTCIVHTIRTQSAIRLREALTPRRGAAQGDDMADLQAAIADDDALDHELQDRLLVGQRRLVQAAADAGAERRQVHPRRFGSQPLLA
jgi:putative transposase